MNRYKVFTVTELWKTKSVYFSNRNGLFIKNFTVNLEDFQLLSITLVLNQNRRHAGSKNRRDKLTYLAVMDHLLVSWQGSEGQGIKWKTPLEMWKDTKDPIILLSS